MSPTYHIIVHTHFSTGEPAYCQPVDFIDVMKNQEYQTVVIKKPTYDATKLENCLSDEGIVLGGQHIIAVLKDNGKKQQTARIVPTLDGERVATGQRPIFEEIETALVFGGSFVHVGWDNQIGDNQSLTNNQIKLCLMYQNATAGIITPQGIVLPFQQDIQSEKVGVLRLSEENKYRIVRFEDATPATEAMNIAWLSDLDF